MHTTSLNDSIFPQNIGPRLSIDETCLSTREVYTIVSKKGAHGCKGCIVAIIKGTKANVVNEGLKKIPECLRMSVEEVIFDFYESMQNIVETCFPKTMRSLDRFHHQQFCLEALQEVRREHRREQMAQDANAREDGILNYFVNRLTNASAESLNAKIKEFRVKLQGIVDK